MKNMLDINRLTNAYSDMIYHIAMRYLNTKEDAEDIVQEVFMRYIANFKAGKLFDTEEYEKYWLIRVTMNLCCNEISSARRRKNLPFKDSLYCELDISSENLLYNSVSKLNKCYKEPFILFYIEEFKITEISKILRISEDTVKKRLSRARTKIKDFIKIGERSFERI